MERLSLDYPKIGNFGILRINFNPGNQGEYWMLSKEF